MILNRIALISLFLFIFFPSLTSPLTDFISILNPGIESKEEVNVARVIVYVTYSTCRACPHDQFHRYYSELSTTFGDMGIQLKMIDLQPDLG